MATIDELRQEPHWSYSALNTYLNICQAQFMYRYVDQAEVEFPSEEVAVEYEGPEWFDDEVTFDSRYQNNNLANK